MKQNINNTSKNKKKIPFPEIQEIWWTRFKYEDDPNRYTVRPVIVMDTINGKSSDDTMTQVAFVSLKGTSRGARNTQGRNDTIGDADDTEVGLYDWRDENLSKPTTVRVSKVQAIRITDFANKLGKVSEMDWRNILKAYRKMVKIWSKTSADWKQRLLERDT